ncbi:MAG: response regulator [Myxococcota bacterium]
MQPHQPHVLIVDDCPVVRTFAAMLLKPHGYHSTVAASLSEATELLAQITFDVVLSDFDLGDGETGHQVFMATRLLETPPVFVLMSSWSKQTIDPEGMFLNDIVFIPKPFEANAFCQTIVDAVARSAQGARLAS